MVGKSSGTVRAVDRGWGWNLNPPLPPPMLPSPATASTAWILEALVRSPVKLSCLQSRMGALHHPPSPPLSFFNVRWEAEERAMVLTSQSLQTSSKDLKARWKEKQNQGKRDCTAPEPFPSVERDGVADRNTHPRQQEPQR